MRELFHDTLKIPFAISADGLEQVNAVAVVAQFEKGQGQSSKQLEDSYAIINDKDKQIANAMLQFPCGRAIVTSALSKGTQQDAKIRKTNEAETSLSALVRLFPSDDSTKLFEEVGKAFTALYEDVDKDTKTEAEWITHLAEPHVNLLQKTD